MSRTSVFELGMALASEAKRMKENMVIRVLIFIFLFFFVVVDHTNENVDLYIEKKGAVFQCSWVSVSTFFDQILFPRISTISFE